MENIFVTVEKNGEKIECVIHEELSKSIQEMLLNFEKEVNSFIEDYKELQGKRALLEDEIDFSKMIIFSTTINANWLPEIAPISYGLVGEQVYAFVPTDDGIICEPLCMWE